MALITYGSAFMALAWLQPICYNPGFVFIHVKLIKIFACGEDFNKIKHRVAATLISSHKSGSHPK